MGENIVPEWGGGQGITVRFRARAEGTSAEHFEPMTLGPFSGGGQSSERGRVMESATKQRCLVK